MAKPGPKPGYEHIRTKKATERPTTRNLEWAAGFLEGEGCFQHSTVTAVQVHKPPILRLLSIFGGSIRRQPEKEGKWNACWRWSASGKRARGIMLTLYCLMSPKRKKQIEKGMHR